MSVHPHRTFDDALEGVLALCSDAHRLREGLSTDGDDEVLPEGGASVRAAGHKLKQGICRTTGLRLLARSRKGSRSGTA